MSEQNDGTANVGVPEETAATGSDGKSQGAGLPEGDQNTGEPSSVADEGKSQAAWLAQLPGDLKHDEELAQYSTIGDYVKAVREREQQNAEGNKKETDSDPAKTEPVKYEDFNKALAQDTDPFGKISEGLVESLQERGIPQKEAEKLFDQVNKAYDDSMKQLTEEGSKWCESQLKKTWGDDYDQNRKAMTRAYVSLVGVNTDLARGLDRTGASINPYVAEVLAKAGEVIREDESTPSNRTGGQKGSFSGGVPIDYSKPTA